MKHRRGEEERKGKKAEWDKKRKSRRHGKAQKEREIGGWWEKLKGQKWERVQAGFHYHIQLTLSLWSSG